jgi:hypothetical protein
MWLMLLGTKDEVANAFTTFQTKAEIKTRRKLGTL